MATRSSSRYFDGTADDIDFGDTTYLDSATALTMACWINPDILTENRCMMAKWAAWVSDACYLLTLESNRVEVGVWENASNRNLYWTSTTASTLMTAGNNYHIAAVWSGGNSWTLYIDGVSKTLVQRLADGSVTNLYNSSAMAQIGVIEGATFPWKGNISYAELYDVALTQEEVQEIMWKPGSIGRGKSFVPCLDGGATESDLVQQTTGTVTGAVVSADGPPVFF